MRQLPRQSVMCPLVASLFVCCFAGSCLAQEFISSNAHLRPGNHTLTLMAGGFERTYILHVPPCHAPRSRLPLVVMLHGGGGTARAAVWETEWTVKADKEDFLVAFPNAMARDPAKASSFARNPQLWNDGSDRFYTGQGAPNDISFIAAMLDDVSTRFDVDKRRVFVTGFSNGASMTFRVGAVLSYRITAIAPVAGALWSEPEELKQPVPLLYITGTADPLNPINGGVPRLATGASDKVRAKPKPPVHESILKWAKALDCPVKPASVLDVDGVRIETYGPGRDGSEVVYISVDGLGHVWAGGKSLLPESIVGRTTDKIKATDVIWEFFQKHKRPGEDKGASQQGAPVDGDKPRR